MHLFVSKFRELQTGRKSDESKGIYATHQIPRKYTTCMPIEKHADKVYTKAMYGIFTNQLHLSGYCAIKHRRSNTRFVLNDTRWADPDTSPETRVYFESDDYIRCECGMYEHMGILYRHALKVLTHLDRRDIPAGNIMSWTKDFDNDGSDMKQLQHLAAQNDELKRKILLKIAFELDKNRSTISNHNFEVAVHALATEQQAEQSSKVEEGTSRDNVSFDKTKFPTSCPPSTYKGGRPQNTALKTWFRCIKKYSKKTTTKPSDVATDWHCEENPYTGKK